MAGPTFFSGAAGKSERRQVWTDLLAAPRPLIMGVLNVTPDSFADGGLYFDHAAALAQARALVAAGADILDIGGESTRPFADPVPLEEELRRVLPVIDAILPEITIPISIDTYKAPVARAALEAGATLINDISALRFDPDMAPLAAEFQAPVVFMHMQGTPRDMQRQPHYHDLLGEIRAFFQERLEFAASQGLTRRPPGPGPRHRLWQNRGTQPGNLEPPGGFSRFGRPPSAGPLPESLYRPPHRAARRRGARHRHPGGPGPGGAARRPHRPYP